MAALLTQAYKTLYPPIKTARQVRAAPKFLAGAIHSDPNHGGEEALGRLFNALAAAYDFKQAGIHVAIYLQGTGTRWAGVVGNPEHPVNGLYNAVADTVAGVSCGCADVFGARENAEKNGFDLITDNSVPGTSGLPSIAKLSDQGYTIVSF